MDKDQALATQLDQLSRAAQVIASQHRIQRDDATMARIAHELRTACASCRSALPARPDMDTISFEARSCLASAERWRAQACDVRAAAQQTHLTEPQRAILRREAEACDRQADEWVLGAEEY